MSKSFSRSFVLLTAALLVVSGFFVSANTALATEEVSLTANPTSTIVGAQALVNKSQPQANINSAVITAIAGLEPVQVTLSNNSVTGYAHVRINPVGLSDFQFWANDGTNWYDINQVGWGPSTGFPLPSPYGPKTTDVYVISDASLGTYSVSFVLKDLVSNTPLATGSGNITVTAGAPSATNSTLICSPNKQITGGIATCNITVKDQSDNPIQGVSVTLSSSDSSNTFGNNGGTTNSDGNVTITFSSTTAGIKTITATAGITTLSTNPSVEFYTSSPTTANIIASPKPQEASLTGADVGLTIYITDQYGNAVPNGYAVGVSGTADTLGIIDISGDGKTLNGQVARVLNFNNKGDVTLTVNATHDLILTGDSVVHFIDTTEPVITITPPNPAEIEYRNTYEDAGATALDNIDGDRTNNIIVGGLPINTGLINVSPINITNKIVAIHVVTYDVSDTSGKPAVQQIRTVNVVDTTEPVITSIISNATSAEPLKISDTINFTLTPTPAEPIATIDGSYNGHVLIWSTTNNGETYIATYTVNEGDTDQTQPLQITDVTMTDEAGNVSTPLDGTDVAKTIDAHRPILTSVHIESNNAHNNLVKIGDTVTLTFVANESISEPTVTIATPTVIVTGGPTNWTATYVMQSSDIEGIVPFTIDGFSDLAGNSNGTVVTTTDASSVAFDKTAPVLSEITPVPILTNDNTPDYTFSSNEVGTITYSGDCSSATIPAVIGNNTITFNTLENGEHSNCIIKVMDVTGNPSDDLVVRVFTIDTALPVVTVINFPAVNIGNQNAVTISGTCSEEGLPVSIVIESVNDNTQNCSSGNWSYTLDLSSLTDGNLTATASQTDTANNSDSGSADSIKDTIAPTVTGLSDDSNPRKSKTWNWGSSEGGSIFRYIIDTNPTWDTPTGDFNGITTATQLDGNGTYYIHVQAQDAVGNIGDVTSVFATLDNIAPVIDQHEGITEVANATGGKSVTYTVTASDSHDGSITAVCVPPSGSFFPLGTTLVTCAANDQAGNTANLMIFGITINPDVITHIFLMASPDELAFSQTSLITVTGKDQFNNTVTNNDSTVVVFSADGGGSLVDTILTLSTGVATTNLSKDSVGIVHVTATSDGLSPISVTVEFTEADVSSPFVQETSPINETAGVAVSVQPYLLFSEPLNASTVTSETVQLKKVGGNTVLTVVSLDFMEGRQRVKITPTNNLDFETQYYFVVTTGVTDEVGNPAVAVNIETSPSYKFTTTTDNTVLAVTSISAVKTYATIGGGYENGWEWTFNVTVPTTETELQMKFADWTSSLNTISVADNIRYSSAQASNGPVEITAANTYGVTSLHLTGDLDSGAAGRQIQIKVEARIPEGSAGGSYSTSYGIQSNDPI